MIAAWSAFGCTDRSHGPAGDDTIVAVVDGEPITARELDESMRAQLDQLERQRNTLRLRRLRRLIAARVLGGDRADAELDDAFAAAQARADIEIRLPVPSMPPAAAATSADDGAATGATQAVRRSDLPVMLVGTVVRDEPAKSMAAVRVGSSSSARNVHPGQPVVDGALLVRVERNRIVLRRNGELEFVPLSVTNEPNTPTPARTLARFVRTPDSVLSLRRADVDRGLRDTSALEGRLVRGAPELDGRRLLIVDSVEPGSLYELLDLQDGDVLMQVNGEWVDDNRNPLWDALRDDADVTLLIMRAGSPRAYAYAIY
jgi:type II secretory pathway component PulC